MIEIPAFGLGSAQFGNLFRARTDAEVHRILAAAWDAGVRHFDTAPHYGLGLAERRLGAFLAGYPRDEYVVSTKVGRLLRPDPQWAGAYDDAFEVHATHRRVWDFSADGIRASLAESLERLGLDRVDIAYVHDPERSEQPTAVDEGMRALRSLRDEGLAARIGVGSMVPQALADGIRAGADIVMAANCCTLLDQSALREVAPVAAESGAQIVAAAVFNSGLLADASAPGAMYDYAAAPSDLVARAHAIETVCRRHGVALGTAAMRYPLLAKEVVAVVAGADSAQQVQDNVARMAAPIPDGLWDELDAQGLVPRCG